MLDQLKAIWERLDAIIANSDHRSPNQIRALEARSYLTAYMRRYHDSPDLERWLEQHKAEGR